MHDIIRILPVAGKKESKQILALLRWRPISIIAYPQLYTAMLVSLPH